MTFQGTSSNNVALIISLDKDFDRQATEAGVFRGPIQKPQRGSEEVSFHGFFTSSSDILVDK